MSKNAKKRKTQKPVNSSLDTRLAYTPGIPVVTMSMPEIVAVLDIATGGLASATNLTAGLLTNFATRFVTFDEYRILKFKFELLPTCPAGGMFVAYVDPLNSSVPTSTTAQTNTALSGNLNSASIRKPYTLIYMPRDTAMQAYQQISTTTFSYGYLKVFTDVNNFANQNTTFAKAIQVRAIITVQFRGFS